MSEKVRLETSTEWAEADLNDDIIYVTYGLIGSDCGTTERLGHFLPSGYNYPETLNELETALHFVI